VAIATGTAASLRDAAGLEESPPEQALKQPKKRMIANVTTMMASRCPPGRLQRKLCLLCLNIPTFSQTAWRKPKIAALLNTAEFH
jgi:hypothetical protein